MASFEKDLRDFVQDTQKNFHFAEVLALTRVVKDVQADVRLSLDKEFILRNKFTQRGIQIQTAKKEQQHPFAEVFSLDKYIAEQEEGANRSLKHGKEFWVPAQDFYRNTGTSKSKRIPKRLRPSTIMTKKINKQRPFRARVKSGADLILVRKSKARLPVLSLYKVSKKPQKITKKPWFIVTVNKSFDKNIENRYNEAIEFAFR